MLWIICLKRVLDEADLSIQLNKKMQEKLAAGERSLPSNMHVNAVKGSILTRPYLT